MPKSCVKTYEASLKSRTAAVKAFCQECAGYDRKVIRYCTDKGCPLWTWRPYQKKKKDE